MENRAMQRRERRRATAALRYRPGERCPFGALCTFGKARRCHGVHNEEEEQHFALCAEVKRAEKAAGCTKATTAKLPHFHSKLHTQVFGVSSRESPPRLHFPPALSSI